MTQSNLRPNYILWKLGRTPLNETSFEPPFSRTLEANLCLFHPRLPPLKCPIHLHPTNLHVSADFHLYALSIAHNVWASHFHTLAPYLHAGKPLRSCNLIKPLFAPGMLIQNPFATDDHRINIASSIITIEINRVINLINYEYLLLRCVVSWQGTFNDGHEIVT